MIDDIFSCGNVWMFREDVIIGGGIDIWRGFNLVVCVFCSKIDGLIVEVGGYLFMIIEVFFNGGKSFLMYGVLGFVDCNYVIFFLYSVLWLIGLL